MATVLWAAVAAPVASRADAAAQISAARRRRVRSPSVAVVHPRAVSPRGRQQNDGCHLAPLEAAVHARWLHAAHQIPAARSHSSQRRRGRARRPQRETQIHALQAQESSAVTPAPPRCDLFVAIHPHFDRVRLRNDLRLADSSRPRRRLRRVSSAAARTLSPSSPVDDHHLAHRVVCHRHLSVPPLHRYRYRGAFVSSPRRLELASTPSRVAQSLAPSSAPRVIAGACEVIHRRSTRAPRRR
mmetsp:Transcript_1991/g.6499  ORF Transcript_1991/g.6499 Transcript_1991/m.6499 type:complete len:242 (+) Transcript_1991:610-1335(+)